MYKISKIYVKYINTYIDFNLYSLRFTDLKLETG